MTVPFPRTVKPRKPTTPAHLGIIAIDEHSAYIERTGEVIPYLELTGRLRSEPSSLFVVNNCSWLLWEFHERLQEVADWQYRITPVKREYYSMNSANKGRRTKTMDTLVNYFGFRGSRQGREGGHWHYMLDPSLFARVKSVELLQGDGPYLQRLHAWGQDVRQWCAEHSLKVTPTAGGIAGQLLRDPRFYPDPRRKVPRATNARAREVLPGNYYKLFTAENRTVDAIYLDMKSAHHNAAADLTFPSSNGLLARGHFRDTDATDATVPDSAPWLSVKDPAYQEALKAHGLFLLRLAVPKIKADRFPPPFMEQSGRRLAWVYSNELPTVHALGGVIEGIEASWTAYGEDPGLNKYAAWALSELATMTDTRKLWAKPTLLATYGILAAKPRTSEFAYLRADGGTPRMYPAGHGVLPAMAHTTLTPSEVVTANVIHRGMIEAETRKRCLDLARALASHGCRVLAIYADAVFVEMGTQLPLMPAPWSVKSECTRLTFYNSTSFTSVQMTRLPGVPQEARERLRIQRELAQAVDSVRRT